MAGFILSSGWHGARLTVRTDSGAGPALVLRHDEHYGAPPVVQIDLDERPAVITHAARGRGRPGSGM